MINFNTEYFGNNCYFYIKDRGNKISLYYNVADTLTESRKSDDKIEFDKKDEKKVKGVVSAALKTKSKVTKKGLDKKLKGLTSKEEIDELVDEDGGFLGSRIPDINHTLSPRKTTDQYVVMARTTNDPVTRGYRVYYGESEEGSDEVINEVDYSEAFGYEETKDMDYNDTVKTLEEMGVENADERAEEFGKIRKAKKKNGILKQRLAEKETLEERQHRLMKKMVEDILTKRPKTDSDVIKNTGVSKILKKNLKAIKNIADKEGISINMLIKALKSSDDE
jgi:vacuolar-type H+-ATPase subunit I/STV1